MNKTYALVWNQALGCWNVASEWARRSGKAGRSKTVVAAAGLALFGVLGQTPAFALPNGGAVVAGNASLQTSADGKQMVINQQSNKLIAQWNEFNVGADERVSFHQPGSDSVALNRVIGTNGSNIQGNIDANGKVFLVNPNGVVFGKSAQINVGGLVASSQNIANTDFLNGNYRFAGNSTAAVSNAGTLIASEGGSVALLGAQVSNTGVIQAQMGSVALGAGKDFSVNFDGNGLLNLQVNSGVVDALAYNGGLLKADSGQVLMTAKSADSLLKTVVSNQGVIEAKTLQNKAGRIILDGGDRGTVQVAGRQDASALGGQGNGGTVENRGAKIEVQSGAQVNTLADKGATGTWKIRSNDVVVAEAGSNSGNAAVNTNGNHSVISDGNIVNSIIGNSNDNRISVSGSGHIVSSAIGNGNGNNVSLNGSASIVDSQIGNGNNNNVSLAGAGNIIGSQIGNGSGNHVSLSGVGSIVGSQIGNNNGNGNGNGNGSNWAGNSIIGSQIGNNNGNGNGSNWPSGSIIGQQIGNNNGTGNIWSNGSIIGQQIGNINGNPLASTNVARGSTRNVSVGDSVTSSNGGTVSTGNSTPTMHADTLAKNLATTHIELVSTHGDLALNAPVSWSSSNTLGLTAERGNVQVNGVLNSSGSNAGLQLNAKQGSLQLNENVSLTGAGSNLELNHGGNGYSLKDGKAVTLSGSGASFQANGQSYEVVQNLEQLRNVENNMAGRYVLGNAIGGTGHFKTIGDGKTFTGTLEGLGNTISDLSIYGTTGYVGLFGANKGQISNLNLERISANGDSSAHNNTQVGTLVGLNTGAIRNVKASDVHVTGAPHFNTLGGLVGINLGGTIENSSVSGQVTGNRNTFAMGGLVGENITDANGMGQVINSRADTIISGEMSGSTSYYGNSAGGLVGLNDGGRITNSSSQGSVNLVGDNLNIGGLVGHNIGSISNATSSASVSAGKNSLLGGLVGFNRQGAVANSSASGQVVGNAAQAIGGLIGKNLGNALANVSASGNVSDGSSLNVGGLVGNNDGGAIVNATATNTVTGGSNANVGGLVGYSRNAAMTNAAASGSVIGGKDAFVGGLVGNLSGGRINASSAKGSVYGGQGSRVGGLVGVNSGQISSSSASATVSGGDYATLGGLVGMNSGSILLSSASGKIDFSPTYGQLYGGLIGMNFGQQYLNNTSGEALAVPMIGRNFRF
ncbi:GLUG motif-containing protein [Pseudomonas sp. NPDC087697]|uniref:two-partner secretion domain-containing protein n=1 Tax=Pseudomonas sp. NPDC087697 TaxID=3364447 RepID=UPI00380BEE3B